MAKRGTLTHRRTRRLAQAMGIELPFALGVMEALFHVTADKAPRGDIGRLSDQDIADEMFWTGDAGHLVEALVEAGLLERDQACRLQVHGWGEHADDAVRKRLHRTGERFADGSPTWRRERAGEPGSSPAPDGGSRAEDVETRPAVGGTVETCPDSGGTRPANGGLPEPLPEPVPDPGQARPVPGQARPAPARPPAAPGRAGGPPDADVVAQLDALSREVAELRTGLGDPTTPETVLLEHSRTGAGATFARPDGGRPAWRRATLDRLRSAVGPLRSQAALARSRAEARSAIEAAAHDPPEARQRAENSWGMVLTCLERELPRQVYATWCRPTSALRERAGELVVLVPTEQFVAWFRDRPELVDQAVRDAGLTCRVSYLAELREAG